MFILCELCQSWNSVEGFWYNDRCSELFIISDLKYVVPSQDGRDNGVYHTFQGTYFNHFKNSGIIDRLYGQISYTDYYAFINFSIFRKRKSEIVEGNASTEYWTGQLYQRGTPEENIKATWTIITEGLEKIHSGKDEFRRKKFPKCIK